MNHLQLKINLKILALLLAVAGFAYFTPGSGNAYAANSSMTQPIQELTVTAPMYGETLTPGTTQVITWSIGNMPKTIVTSSASSTSANAGTVNIVLYNLPAINTAANNEGTANNPMPYVIATNVPNSGSYVWTVPSSLNPQFTNGNGNEFIAITSTDGTISGLSGLFKISSAGETGIAVPETGTTTNTNTPTSNTTTPAAATNPNTNNMPPSSPGASLGSNNAATGAHIGSAPAANATNNTGNSAINSGGTTSGSAAGNIAPNNGNNTSTASSIPGILVKVDGSPTVYLENGGSFTPFDSAQVFLANGYQWSQVQTIPASAITLQDINPIPVLAPNGSMISNDNGQTVYQVGPNGRITQMSSLPANSSASIINVSPQDWVYYVNTKSNSTAPVSPSTASGTM